MKKIITALVFCFMLTNLSAFGFKHIGPMVGMNYTSLQGDDAENTDAKPNITAGAYLIFSLTPLSDIEIDLLYAVKSSENKFEINNAKEEYDLTYLDMPVLFKRKLPIPGPITPSIFAGPVFSFLINDEYSYKVEGADLSDAIKIDYNTTDLSFLVGASLEISKFHIDLRYSLGITEVIDNYKMTANDNVSENDTDLKTNSLNVNIGYSFF